MLEQQVDTILLPATFEAQHAELSACFTTLSLAEQVIGKTMLLVQSTMGYWSRWRSTPAQWGLRVFASVEAHRQGISSLLTLFDTREELVLPSAVVDCAGSYIEVWQEVCHQVEQCLIILSRVPFVRSGLWFLFDCWRMKCWECRLLGALDLLVSLTQKCFSFSSSWRTEVCTQAAEQKDIF